jgi:hypothetical protein
MPTSSSSNQSTDRPTALTGDQVQQIPAQPQGALTLRQPTSHGPPPATDGKPPAIGYQHMQMAQLSSQADWGHAFRGSVLYNCPITINVHPHVAQPKNNEAEKNM